MNIENFKLVLDKIKSCPSQWKQNVWHCGTAHCFAGWAQILSGNKEDERSVRRDARVFLDISNFDANYLFAATTTLSDFETFFTKHTDFNRHGFDRDGFNSHGFNRAGFNRDGYGFNSYGFDRDGLDKNNKPKPE